MPYNPQVFMKQCLEKLGSDATVLSQKETAEQWNLLKRMFPFGRTGKVEWEKINIKAAVGSSAQEILDALKILLQEPVDKTIYIQWSDAALPIVKVDLDKALSIVDDLKKVTFELFLFNPAQGYLIELLQKNQITVGLINGPQDI